MADVTNTSLNAVNKNMIIPEVYASIVNAKIAGKVVVANACKTFGDLMGKAGETLTFPKIAYIGDASEIKVGNAIPTSKLKTTTTSATIKEIAPDGIEIYDYDNAVEFENSVERAAEQQAISIARKIDAMAIAEAVGSPLTYNYATENVLTFDELNGILATFGDDANSSDFWGIVIPSAFVPSVVAMQGFVDAHYTTSADQNGVMENNLLGYFRGIKVFVSDRVQKDSKNAVLAIKNDALGIIPKESVYVETARDAAKRATTVYTSQFLAVARVDDAGIVVATAKA